MPDDGGDELEPIDTTLDATARPLSTAGAAPTQQPPPLATPSPGTTQAWGYDVGSPSLPSRTHNHRWKIGAAVAAIVVLVLIAGAVGYAINDNSRPTSSKRTTAPGPSTAPTPAPAADPNAAALGLVVLQQRDVPSDQSVQLIPNGNRLSQPSLDLCNGSFASERLRTARLQVAEIDSQGRAVLSTEAVLYRNAAATTQAFAEVRKIAAQCPSTPVISPVGEPAVTTTFNMPPDQAWPHTANVDRLAYDVVSNDPQAGTFRSIVVYLRRGRLLTGVYFSQPNATQSPVATKTSIRGIVGVFESRIAKLPSTIVTG